MLPAESAYPTLAELLQMYRISCPHKGASTIKSRDTKKGGGRRTYRKNRHIDEIFSPKNEPKESGIEKKLIGDCEGNLSRCKRMRSECCNIFRSNIYVKGFFGLKSFIVPDK